MTERPHFVFEPDDANPGWYSWTPTDASRFNGFLGSLIVRTDGPARAQVRVRPEHRHSNLASNIHGGALLGYVDVSLFAAARALGLAEAARAVTLDISAHFIAAGRPAAFIDIDVDLLRETGRLMFMRGLIVQSGETLLSFSGTIRKPGRGSAAEAAPDAGNAA